MAERDRGSCRWFCGDLSASLPLPDASVSRVVCHDVLECVADAPGLLDEVARVMQPRALSVWSHVDYEAILIGGGDRILTRRIVNAYADASYLKAGSSDAQMARKLAALVDHSRLSRVGIDAVSLIATTLAGPGRHRVDDIAATVVRSTGDGACDVGAEEVRRWLDSLERADERGEFFYSHTAYMGAPCRDGGRHVPRPEPSRPPPVPCAPWRPGPMVADARGRRPPAAWPTVPAAESPVWGRPQTPPGGGRRADVVGGRTRHGRRGPRAGRPTAHRRPVGVSASELPCSEEATVCPRTATKPALANDSPTTSRQTDVASSLT